MTVDTMKPSNGTIFDFFSYISHPHASEDPANSSKALVTPKMNKKVIDAFPRAVPNAEIVQKVVTALQPYGYGKTTLLASSLCCDEVCRVLEKDFQAHYGEHFSMGGLAGMPFGGVTSFGAMAHHIPQDGSCLIIFAPHVGIDEDGNVGSVNRRGRPKPGACCGSACAAYGYVKSVHNGECPPIDNSACIDPVDAQQAFVSNLLMPYAAKTVTADKPMVQLPLSLYAAQKTLMEKIIAAACQEVHGGNIAILGGIQVNTPNPETDYFVPMDFEIRNNKNQKIKDLMW